MDLSNVGTLLLTKLSNRFKSYKEHWENAHAITRLIIKCYNTSVNNHKILYEVPSHRKQIGMHSGIIW